MKPAALNPHRLFPNTVPPVKPWNPRLVWVERDPKAHPRARTPPLPQEHFQGWRFHNFSAQQGWVIPLYQPWCCTDDFQLRECCCLSVLFKPASHPPFSMQGAALELFPPGSSQGAPPAPGMLCLGALLPTPVRRAGFSIHPGSAASGCF